MIVSEAWTFWAGKFIDIFKSTLPSVKCKLPTETRNNKSVSLNGHHPQRKNNRIQTGSR